VTVPIRRTFRFVDWTLRPETPQNFRAPAEVVAGTVVFDKDCEMPGVVDGREDRVVFLSRPTGRKWRVYWSRVRPATEWEKRQLVAVGRLHALRQKGV